MENETLNPARALGRFLQAMRKCAGLSQAELASKIGLTRAAYASFEVGRITPSLAHLHKISQTLDADMGPLINAYFFPSRRQKKRSGLSDDGLNPALLRLIARLQSMDAERLENAAKVIELLAARDTLPRDAPKKILQRAHGARRSRQSK